MANLISKNEFSSLIQEYASYKRSIQGCSQKTVDEYLLDLRTFFRYLIAREKDIPFQSEEFFTLDISSVGLDILGKIRAEDLYDYLAYITDDRENQREAKHGDGNLIEQHCYHIVGMILKKSFHYTTSLVYLHIV